MTTYYEKVQNALIGLAKGGYFRRCEYMDDQATISDTVEQPTSAEANETSCEFGLENVRTRRTYMKERQNWRWSLVVRFQNQVSDQLLLDELSASLYKIPADDELRAVGLELRAAYYEHPPRANPQSGSRIRYEFEAKLAPK